MNYVMFILEILGTIAFSVSGAIEAMKKEMDMLGVLVLGLVTAVGGGIFRDIIIGKLPPSAFQDPLNPFIALCTAFITFVVGFIVSRRKKGIHKAIWNQILLVSDAIGLGVFTVLGIRHVQELTVYENTAMLLFVGVVTGVGGGIIRDIFAGNIPYIFRKHVYATASIAGAISYLYLETIISLELAAIVSVVIVLALRLLAAKFEWNLPKVRL